MSKDIEERLAGIKEAVKEGFEHTNPARVKMTPDESMEDKTKDLLPVSEKDIEKLGGEQADISQGPKAHEKLLIEKLKKVFKKEERKA
jgi:hypothetical protein